MAGLSLDGFCFRTACFSCRPMPPIVVGGTRGPFPEPSWADSSESLSLLILLLIQRTAVAKAACGPATGARKSVLKRSHSVIPFEE